MSFGATSFLFTGDAERAEEQDLLNAGVNLQSTVLKVGHHGSDTSTSYPFLRAVAPQYAVISVGAGNSYGHPTEAVLSRLRDAGVTTFRTDMQGEITAVSDGQTINFSTAKNATAETLANAGAGQNADQAGGGNSATQTAGTDRTQVVPRLPGPEPQVPRPSHRQMQTAGTQVAQRVRARRRGAMC